MEEMSKTSLLIRFLFSVKRTNLLLLLVFLSNTFAINLPLLAESALYQTKTTTVDADISLQAIPLSSFLFAHKDPMRVGWNPVGSTRSEMDQSSGILFVQLKPRKNEGEYRLALRVLRDGVHQFKMIRTLSGGSPINHRKYLTIPFEYLIGAIQGEAIRSLFPNDRVESGGWFHKVTYVWETPQLLSNIFLKQSLNTANIKLKQGEKWIIPWNQLRNELDLEPMAVREPLQIRKDESGYRFAYYKIQSGDTLYTSVVSRFLGETLHEVRNQAVGDLLLMNQMADPHQLIPGTKIKIPLEWLSSEYLHPIPTIYRVSNETSINKFWSESMEQDGINNNILYQCEGENEKCSRHELNVNEESDGLPLKIRISPQQFSQK